MFATIIIGVDGGDGGADAVALATSLATPSTKLLAVSLALVDTHPSRGANRDFDHVLHEQAAARLTHATDGNARLEGEVLFAATVGAGLHAAAERHDADLIVVGSCRRGPLGRVLAGDDAKATVRDAPCAVAIAPAGYAQDPKPLRTVGLGWDGTPQSEHALEVARAIAAEAHAEILALEVVGLPLWPVPEASMAGQELATEVADAKATVGALPGVSGRVVTGLATEELMRFAHDVDLMIVGTHHRSPLNRVVIGSTAEGLARHCPCPLVVVPRTAQPALAGS
jgi:nucleotide-binding universal stress UspA family protein